ncbi:hypothetical protein Trydic_g14293 [Trypoxylus dichotomus]
MIRAHKGHTSSYGTGSVGSKTVRTLCRYHSIPYSSRDDVLLLEFTGYPKFKLSNYQDRSVALRLTVANVEVISHEIDISPSLV